MPRDALDRITQRGAGSVHPEPKAEGNRSPSAPVDDRHAHFVCVGGAVGASCFRRTLIPKSEGVYESVQRRALSFSGT